MVNIENKEVTMTSSKKMNEKDQQIVFFSTGWSGKYGFKKKHGNIRKTRHLTPKV